MAFNTPFKMWKRYEFNGGTSDPCIISWPAGIEGPRRDPRAVPPRDRPRPDDPRRARRRAARDDQGAHAVAVRRRQHARAASTTPPPSRAGRRSSTRCSARARSGTRAGRRSRPIPCIAGWGNFNDDEWELYHTDVDRSELHNLAAEQPDKLRELVNIWFSEAGANGAFPLDDRSPVEILTTPRPQLTAPRDRVRLLPGRGARARVAGGQHQEPLVRDRRARRHPGARAPRACSSPTARGSAATRSTSRTTGCTTSTASSAPRSR